MDKSSYLPFIILIEKNFTMRRLGTSKTDISDLLVYVKESWLNLM